MTGAREAIERAAEDCLRHKVRDADTPAAKAHNFACEDCARIVRENAATLQADAVSEAVDFKSRVERIKQLLIDCREQGLSDYGTACAIAIALHACDEANNEEWE